MGTCGGNNMTHYECMALMPPPFPDRGYHKTLYTELYNFVKSNQDFYDNLDEYNCMCNQTLLPPADPDRTSTSKVVTSTTMTSTRTTTQSMMGSSTSAQREVTTSMSSAVTTALPYDAAKGQVLFSEVRDNNNDDTASAGLTIGLIVCFSLIFIAIGIVLFVIWMKKHREKARNGALNLDEYQKSNYLHNKATKNEPWNSSSPQESKDENNSHVNLKIKNGTENQVFTNGGDKITDDLYEARKSTTCSDKIEDNLYEMRKSTTSDHVNQSYVNDNFTVEQEVRKPDSPEVRSYKSDTPLIDDTPLPNQAMHLPDGKHDEHNSTKVPSNGNYGSVEKTKSKNTALPPITQQDVQKVERRSPKKKRSLAKVPRSEECKATTNGLTEDIAENRNSA